MDDMANFDRGTPGGSARRESLRRQAAPERETMERHPRIGRALVALQTPDRKEATFASGAAGEELVASSLERRCPDVIVLHDRRRPRTTANIDHLAVAASGVYVIDAKRYRGKVRIASPLIGPERLIIDGRDRTKLVDGLERQVEAVRAAMDSAAPPVAVRGCFCFVPPDGLWADSGIPLIRTLSIRGFPLYYPRRLAKRLNSTGKLSGEDQRQIATELAQRFPPA